MRGTRVAGVVWGLLMASTLVATSLGPVADPDLVVAPAGATVAPVPQEAPSAHPNIILITTDDMAKTDLTYMPETRKLIGDAGATVGDFLSNHPLCCPARAEILTGQYAQNNGVRDNGGEHGGYGSLARPGNNVAAWLQKAGYRTAFVGKHMNGWSGDSGRQPGWTVFDPILDGAYAPRDLTMYNNGSPKLYPGVHTSDLMGRLTQTYIKRFGAGTAPFFIWTSQVAPHGMLVDGAWTLPVPAARHQGLYPDAIPPALADPAFNELDVSDKPAWVQETVEASAASRIAWHRARIRSLRSVDDQVKNTVDALYAAGELRNTYLFFTSDNGYLLGEHRLGNKNKPYEQSLKIPLVVRGPGIPHGVVRRSTYGIVDLPATFVDLANATPARRLDGRSMAATLRRGAPGYGGYLIQAAVSEASSSTGPAASYASPWWWRGVRTRQFVYVRYDDGFEELYDMRKDPAQLDNVAGDPAYAGVQKAYAARLAVLADCVGATCRGGGLP